MNEKHNIKKTILLILLLLFLIPNTSFAERWQTIKNEEYGVSMQAPATWNMVNTTLKRPDGSLILLGLFHKDTYVTLIYRPEYLPANSYADYDKLQRDIAASVAVSDFKKAEPDSELVWKGFVGQGDHLALELLFKTHDGGKETYHFLRALIKNHHLYGIVILFKHNQDTISTLPIITNSLKFEQEIKAM